MYLFPDSGSFPRAWLDPSRDFKSNSQESTRNLCLSRLERETDDCWTWYNLGNGGIKAHVTLLQMIETTET